MERDFLSFTKLFEVFSYIQGRAWDSLPQAGNKQIYALSNRQIKAMMLVYMRSYRGQKALTLSEFARLLNMKKAAASLLVSDLAEKQLLSRTVDPDNRRFIRITTTAKARRLREHIVPQVKLQIDEMLRNLAADERQAFNSVIDKIYDCYSRKVEGVE